LISEALWGGFLISLGSKNGKGVVGTGQPSDSWKSNSIGHCIIRPCNVK